MLRPSQTYITANETQPERQLVKWKLSQKKIFRIQHSESRVKNIQKKQRDKNIQWEEKKVDSIDI